MVNCRAALLNPPPPPCAAVAPICHDSAALPIIPAMTAPAILHYGRIPWPAPWPAIFGREAPLLLELGFGGGDFLVDLAAREPGANVLGLEISLPALRRGARKIARAGLVNARVMQGESRSVLWLLCTPASVSGVTINFPDPWPKAAHHHRRVINDAFMELLASRMRRGAHLDVATDHEEYAGVIAETLERTPYFASRLDAPFTLEDDGRLRTKYERIALAEGRTCRYFKWQRNDTAVTASFQIPEEKPVPHMVLLPSKSLDELAGSFRPFATSVGDVRVRFLDLYRSMRHELLLVEAYVSEEPFHQRVGLAIRRRKEGDLVVSLQEMGFPRPTPGMHIAVDQLVKWLQEVDPGLAVAGSTVAVESEVEALD